VSVAEGAWDVSKANGKMLVALFEDVGDILALNARIQQDEFSSNIVDLQQISAQVKVIEEKYKRQAGLEYWCYNGSL